MNQQEHEREYPPVAAVVMRCPASNKFFPTGLAMDVVSFNSSTMADNQSRCPHCGRMHRWGDSEVALDN